MIIYFISGLGADRRVFQKLKLPEGFTAQYIDWIKPFEDESLEAYSKRMATAIDTSKPFVLVGLSMGGMVSIEIAKFTQPKLVILISSIKSIDELPWYYKLGGTFQLDKI